MSYLSNLRFFYPLLMLHSDEITKMEPQHVDWPLLSLLALGAWLFALTFHSLTLSTSSFCQFPLFLALSHFRCLALLLSAVGFCFASQIENEGEKNKLIEAAHVVSSKLVREEGEVEKNWKKKRRKIQKMKEDRKKKWR